MARSPLVCPLRIAAAILLLCGFLASTEGLSEGKHGQREPGSVRGVSGGGAACPSPLLLPPPQPAHRKLHQLPTMHACLSAHRHLLMARM